jgi:hypothetical protein
MDPSKASFFTDYNRQPPHSQFVDDTLLMNTPTAQEAIKLSSILSDFSEASGTTFNLAKIAALLFQYSFGNPTSPFSNYEYPYLHSTLSLPGTPSF